MNWALRSYLEDLAQVYRGETGMDVGDIVEVAERSADRPAGPMAAREPDPFAYAYAAGEHIVASVDEESLGQYPEVRSWPAANGVETFDLLSEWSEAMDDELLDWGEGLYRAAAGIAASRGIPDVATWASEMDEEER